MTQQQIAWFKAGSALNALELTRHKERESHDDDQSLKNYLYQDR